MAISAALTITQAIGGLGLFLLGMIVMTDGLRALAGQAMRTALMRFTRNPLTGAVTGAATTALLQSSSATTVATIGFVSAGLISFPAALGIIFGANIGTTVTGWLVAILGFKLQLGTVVLPLIFIGTSLKLLSSKRYAQIGYAIAGFGLIFVGITAMQEAMAGSGNWLTPDQLPHDTLLGRLQLLLIGVAVTIVTQSSSAGVAATLAALYTGAITFAQGAALVIGMDVGTTITAVLATVGGSTSARRTGLSHVIYNLISASIALLCLSPYLWIWQAVAPGQLLANAEIGLVAFHTSFNLVSVAVILPFTQPFAHLIKTLVPSKFPTHTDRLDETLLAQPSLALNAVQTALQSELLALLSHLQAILQDPNGRRMNLQELQTALDETHTYLDRIQLSTQANTNWNRLVAMMHALDHLQRLHERCEEEEDRASTVTVTATLEAEYRHLLISLQSVVASIQVNRWIEAAHSAQTAATVIHRKVKPYRDSTMAQIASSQIDVLTGTAHLEAVRWLRRVSKHVARITEHLSQAAIAVGESVDHPPV